MGIVTALVMLVRATVFSRATIATENLVLRHQLRVLQRSVIRRECLDHLIVFSKAHLQQILTRYFEYYHETRTHLSLERNAPIPRQVEPPSRGCVIAISHVGGLHHRYTRAA
jgi:hypothetical protein